MFSAARPTMVAVCLDELGLTHRSLYLSWLDESERSRYNAMASPKTANCFLAGRAIVKQSIADFLGTRPADIELTVAPSGKPELASVTGTDNIPSLHFSISHKYPLLVVGFSLAPVGIDFEPILLMDRTDIARRFFTTIEADQLLALDQDSRKDYFTRIWVLKEAEVKRRGSSLAELLSTVAFIVEDDVIRCQGAAEEGHFQLFEMTDWGQHGYLALASSVRFPGIPFALTGLPVAGYKEIKIVKVAGSPGLEI